MTVGRHLPPIRAPARPTTRCWSILPDFVAARGFANAKAGGYEADDLLAACWSRAILFPLHAGEMACIDPTEVRESMASSPCRSRT